MEMRNSLDNRRTAFALDEAANNRALKSVAEGLPVALRTQGLLVTLARLFAGREDEQAMADIIARWLSRQPHLGLASERYRQKEALLPFLVDTAPARYRAIEAEALRLSERIKLFCQALHDKDDDSSPEARETA
jgi:hypothetical protein